MKQIVELTNDPRQNYTVIGENGEQIDLTLEYKETQELWSASIRYESFEVNNLYLTSRPNILRQWKNIIPFGILVGTNDNADPYYLDDFVNGRAQVFLLNEEDVQAVEEEFYSA